ncbi:MAG: UDP-N-acetylmuramoyl-L-alanine--D-glutamate ligase [Candidatus Schekmanbacteria bacterium]|nr:UDP-N-acetylmuramoyl-L-alanine--D-glutamate ligase [Candidatus Schekmanbacteria bacterium]
MLNVAGKKITVLGLARSGVAAANLLVQKGAEVTVTDMKTEAALSKHLAKLDKRVKLCLGGHSDELFVNPDLIIISPGIPLTIPPVIKAQKAGKKIISELELAYRMTEIPFIAIGGTNGKTTTTTLVGELLKAAGLNVSVGGNIGFAACQALMDNPGADYWVTEVSSFQTDTIEQFRPYIALLLNITPDHLDRYPTYADYIAAKARLFLNQTEKDFAILNADDPLVLKAAHGTRAVKFLFSRLQDLPEGIMVRGGRIMIKWEGLSSEICSIDDLGIQGTHNVENALAASAAAVICGMSSPLIKKVLAGFQPLEHRMEFVTYFNGITFINDSKGTNIGAVFKSLDSFDQPIVLIAGGKDKGGDFSSLEELVKERVRNVVLIGEATAKFKEDLPAVQDKLHEADTMQNAVRKAFALAQKGDVVLLSPACASFDMFENYEERGRIFKAAVKNLEQEVTGERA